MKKSVNNQFVPAVEISENGKVTVTIRKEITHVANPDEIVPRHINFQEVNYAIRHLVEGRMKHCEMQLAEATAKGEVAYTNESRQQIIYKNGGHFSIPVYQDMEQFLISGEDAITQGDINEFGKPNNKALVIQQALRHLLFLLNLEALEPGTAKDELDEIQRIIDISLLGNILTEALLIG